MENKQSRTWIGIVQHIEGPDEGFRVARLRILKPAIAYSWRSYRGYRVKGRQFNRSEANCVRDYAQK